MKWVVYFLFLFLFSPQLSAQGDAFICNTDDFWNYTLESQPQLRSFENLLELKYQQQASPTPNNSRGGLIILPVVVHIIHDNGPEDISDSRVQLMIDWLNDAFRNRNSFYNNLGIDFQIEFCLAQRDTQGLATNGIIRHQSIYTDMSLPSAANQIYSIATWDPEQYINIRLVREVCHGGSCNTAGYASMPPAHGDSFDGLVFESKYAGSTQKDASVITHEIGHYLGLLHTFLGGCRNNDCLTDGDHVCDTPPDNMTGPFPCDVLYNTCKTDEDDPSINNPFRSTTLGGLGDQPDMIQNYMDYSAYTCYDRFTTGQKNRVNFFLNSARASLLSSKACLPPCPNEPIAYFSISDDTIYAGDQVFTDNSSQFASQYNWYINGIPAGHAADTSFLITIPGTYLVSLVAENNLLECSTSAFESEIVVQCPVQSMFSYSLDGALLYVQDLSVLSDSIRWIINDGSGLELFSSHQVVDTFDLTGIGYVQICQYAYDEFCLDKQCIYVSLIASGIEICNNQIDDDGDHLVDSFDPDCPCSDSTYQAICEQPCQKIPDSFPDLSMHIKWQSEILGNLGFFLPNIIVGNADKADIEVEIVTRKSLGAWLVDTAENNIIILEGGTGLTKTEFQANPNKTYHDHGFLSMGDIDRDGSAEIFCKIWDTLFCYNTNGTRRWVSDRLNIGEGDIVNITDFNGDGVAEVYSGNNIVNAENGKLLLNSLLSAGCNIPNGALFTTCAYNHSIAADLLPSPGLELAAGNIVYEIVITNLNGTTGNTMIPVIADSPILDGYTSVGDIDGDGELDVIVVRDISFPDGGGIWVWNPRTRALIASAPSGPSGGIPFIGDVDGDCAPEIGMTFENQLRMYKYNGTPSLQLLYNLPTTDNSGYTSITMFDFNQDGKNELIYHDETALRIIDGIDGSTIASYPIKSWTGFEYPVIADVDQDGEAEILTTGYLNDPKQQRVFCFEGTGSRWAPARQVWNQTGYSVTNVNDDLTIPRYPQNTAKPLPGYEKCLLPTCATPYNSFMAQATYRTQAGCVQFPAHDLSIDLVSYTCQPDSVRICFTVKNVASLAIQQELIPFTVWPANPFLLSTTPIFLFDYLLDLKSNEGTAVCFAFPMIQNLDSIFIMVNDPGTTMTPYAYPKSSLSECNYENNIELIHMDLATHSLDLGPDITKCESEVITLNAGSDFVSYLWSDNSNDSLYSSSLEGIHFVETTDQCGRVYADTVNFHYDFTKAIHLGNDTSVCIGKLLTYDLPGNYDWISWIPSGNVNCDTCSTIELTTDTSLYLVAIVGEGNCIFQDSVAIDVNHPTVVDTFLKMCFGDTLLFRGMELTTKGQFSLEIEPCDTLYNITLDIYPPDLTFLSSDLCANDSIWFNGLWLHTSGSYSEVFVNNRGCDSIVNLELSIMPPLSQAETITGCDGDSIFIFNQWIHANSVLQDTFSSVHGCDSIVTMQAIFSPYIFQTDTFKICQGDSIQINGTWVRTAGTYLDTISSLPCDIIRLSELVVSQKNVTTEHYILCPGDSIWIENNWVTTSANIQDTLQNSLGCDSISLITIDAIPIPGELPLLNDIIVEPNVPLQLQLPLNANEWSVQWHPADIFSCAQCLNTSLLTNQNTEVNVMLTDEDGCVYIDSFMVFVSEKTSTYYIPNVFSPNGDGQNDIWHISFDPSKGNIELLEVFDRWGNLIHKGSSQIGNFDWDGTYYHQLVSSGVYTYKLLFQQKGSTLLTVWGTLTLIR